MVTNASTYGVPACTSVARVTVVVRPDLICPSRTVAGPGRATRRNWELVATGWSWGEASTTARSSTAMR